jgi:hypothetical protein
LRTTDLLNLDPHYETNNVSFSPPRRVQREEDIKVLLDGSRAVSAKLAGRDPSTDLAVLTHILRGRLDVIEMRKPYRCVPHLNWCHLVHVDLRALSYAQVCVGS